MWGFWRSSARVRRHKLALISGALASGAVGFALGSAWRDREGNIRRLYGGSDMNPLMRLIPTRNINPPSAADAFKQGPPSIDSVPNLQEPTGEDKPLTRYSIANAAAKVSPAVVNVTVVPDTSQWGGWGPRHISQSSGTGFIINADGHLLTNAHVVAQARGGGSIQITLPEGKTLEGRVTTFDSLSDLAIVKVDTDEALPVAKLGKSGVLRAGEMVAAVGSPLTLKNSITAGIISNSGRESYEIGLGGFSATPAFIQTDAAINVGNSGGPLVNLDGEVIGINTMKVESVDGISFAIPIDYAKDIIGQLTSEGIVRRPYLGVKLLTVTSVLMKELKRHGRRFPASFEAFDSSGGKDTDLGVMVHEVLPQSPADRGGLRAGDIIISVGGEPLTTTRQFIEVLTNKIESPIKLTVIRGRDGSTVAVTVTPEVLGGRP